MAAASARARLFVFFMMLPWISASIITQGEWLKENGAIWQQRRSVEGVGAHIDVKESDSHVTGQLGHSAFLKCTVRNLADQTVSWARQRDWHILTSGRQVFTADERFGILWRNEDETKSGSHHGNVTSEWILQIQFVQTNDAGSYICQVPTEHGLLSHEVRLEVLVPEVFILGQKDLIVNKGTTLSLVCIVENTPIPPEFVFWYHNERLLNFDPSRAGVSVETEHVGRTHSQLKIADAQEADTGNYTCRASTGQPATIYVQVWSGDHAAAMSRKNGATVTRPHRVSVLSRSILFLFLHVTIQALRR